MMRGARMRPHTRFCCCHVCMRNHIASTPPFARNRHGYKWYQRRPLMLRVVTVLRLPAAAFASAAEA
jgi:hypothetical protein